MIHTSFDEEKIQKHHLFDGAFVCHIGIFFCSLNLLAFSFDYKGETGFTIMFREVML